MLIILRYRYSFSKDIWNWIVGAWTLSKYSHVEIYIPEEDVTIGSYINGGVQAVPGKRDGVWKEQKFALSKVEAFRFNKAYEKILEANKGYDWSAILFWHVLNIKIQNKSKYHCAEFVAKLLNATFPEFNLPETLTPGRLFKEVQKRM